MYSIGNLVSTRYVRLTQSATLLYVRRLGLLWVRRKGFRRDQAILISPEPGLAKEHGTGLQAAMTRAHIIRLRPAGAAPAPCRCSGFVLAKSVWWPSHCRWQGTGHHVAHLAPGGTQITRTRMARVLIGIAPTATQKRIGSAGLRWPVKKVPDVDPWG